jgi:hypothetical protein
MSIAAYFGECVDCGVMTSLWHSGRGLICGPCAIGHMDRAGEQADEQAGATQPPDRPFFELLGSCADPDEPEWTDEDLEINTATNAAARADELEDARAEVAALTCLLEEARRELDDARTGRDIAAVYDEMERMRVALERERDNAREAANIRMAELGEEIDQLKEEADRREAVIVKMREALSVAGVCDLCGEEVERLAGLEGGEG